MDLLSQPICRFLDWDSQFFGRRIARLERSILANPELEAALEWCQNERIDCLYYLAPANAIESIHIVENEGFHLVDIRMTFELPDKQPATYKLDPQIRPAQSGDIPVLKEIARLAYQSTRFFNDNNFPEHLCEQLYMTWIENSCTGYAQAVWVADPGSGPVGFITCHIANGLGQIGLVGIHPDYHHQGWGRRLVNAALNWFSDQGCCSVRVVTQGNNLAAQKLYAACGFAIYSVELWYHRWFSEVSCGSLDERISDTL